MAIIPKQNLKVGAYYTGHCRNSDIARWTGDRFLYWRYKFGLKFLEEIYHPDDDHFYDVFEPYFETVEVDKEIPLGV